MGFRIVTDIFDASRVLPGLPFYHLSSRFSLEEFSCLYSTTFVWHGKVGWARFFEICYNEK